MTARWANNTLPQVNDVCSVMGDLAGLYQDGDHQSLLFHTWRMTVIHRPSAEENISMVDEATTEENPGDS